MSEVSVSISLTRKEQGALYMAHLAAKKKIADVIVERDKLKAALERISRPHDCGCVPCAGSCVGLESLQITVDEMRETARQAIAKATA